MLSEPSKSVPFICFLAANLLAVLAFPFNVAFIVAGNFNAAFPEPSTCITGPVFVASLSETLKFLFVAHTVAVLAFPVRVAFIVAGNLTVALALPLKAVAGPVLVPSLSDT